MNLPKIEKGIPMPKGYRRFDWLDTLGDEPLLINCDEEERRNTYKRAQARGFNITTRKITGKGYSFQKRVLHQAVSNDGMRGFVPRPEINAAHRGLYGSEKNGHKNQGLKNKSRLADLEGLTL